MSMFHRLLFPNESRKIEELEQRVKHLEASIVKIVTAVNNTTNALEKISHYIAAQELEKELNSSRSIPSVRQHKKEYIN